MHKSIVLALLLIALPLLGRARDIPQDNLLLLTKALKMFASLPEDSGGGLSVQSCGQLVSYQLHYSSLAFANKNYFKEVNVEKVGELFQARQAIRRRLGEMSEKETVPRDCVLAIKQLFSIMRTIEESLSEVRSRVTNEVVPFVTGGSFAIHKTTQFDEKAFRSGDILLSMGDSNISAAISRINADYGHFSHIAMVYQDEASQKLFTIESHLKNGLTVAPLDDYLTNDKVRVALYRHSNARLAHLAAETMFKAFAQGVADPARALRYDFKMDSFDGGEVYCSEVAAMGYYLASKKMGLPPIKIPLFSSTLGSVHRSFLEQIGVKMGEVFAPEDIDIDPRFELIAEWKNLEQTRNVRLREIILSTMFRWMDDSDYVFVENVGEATLASVALLIRQHSFFGRLLNEVVPENIETKALATLMAADHVAAQLFNVIEEDLWANVAWVPPQTFEVYIRERLEEIRQKDYDRFVERKAGEPLSLFHYLFRPKNTH